MGKNLKQNKRHCTSVITDIRNFSKTFKDFQYAESDKFLEFIEKYYMLQNKLARTLSNSVHMSSTGDGILAIFLDRGESHKTAFAYTLASNRMLNRICKEFMDENPGTMLSYGMGADSGDVWKIGDGFLRTYVGTVINRSSRIESKTKLFDETTTAIGNSLYRHLVKDYYPSIYKILQEGESYDAVLNDNPEAILISKQFALQYAFNMPLKGIEGSAPIFRMSESLVSNDKLFWSLMEKLTNDKTELIKQII